MCGKMDNWKNILDEDNLKSNVNFAAMFVLNFECLKDYVVSQIRDFYSDSFHFENEKLICNESKAYKDHVRTLDKNIENASLKWFIQSGAITQHDFDDYQKIRKRRNDITHEFLKNLNDGFSGNDKNLFDKMITIYTKIDKWWINEIEIPTSAEDISADYDRENVCGGQAIILSIINSIILDGMGDEYKELLTQIMKLWND